MTPKLPINCSHCGALFYRKGRGGREKQCSVTCRFWSKVAVGSGCFEWQGGLFTKTGYGQFALTPSKPITAHRMSWELVHGAVPAGLQLLHRCDNRRCVKPEHLFLGTQADNVRDMVEKGRHVGSTGWRASPAQRAARSAATKLQWEARREQ